MKKYEYAKLCINREPKEFKHRFETRQTGEVLEEGEYGLIGLLDELGERGWHAFNKTHHTIWFARVAAEKNAGPADDSNEETFGGDIIPIKQTNEKPLFVQEEREEALDPGEKFYFAQFSLGHTYKFIHLLHTTLQEASRIAAALQLQNKKKYKQHLSGPLESAKEIREEVLLKSTSSDGLIANFQKLDEDPHYRNLEGRT